MATEVLSGSDRRVPISGYGLPAPLPPPPPPPESLLGRLDQIDLRLRQLEEQRRPSSADDGACFAGDARRAPPVRHHHSKSMPSALQQQHANASLRGTLMDRLNLLESRIRQLSSELDDGGKGAPAGSSVAARAPPAEDRKWNESLLLEPCGDPAAAMDPADKAAAMDPADKSAAAAGSWSAVQILQRGARQLHRNKPNPTQVKKLKETKCACQEEKGKAERNRAGRRWFTVGC